MNQEEIKYIFNIFCDSWHLNSYSGYYRYLMLQLDDFEGVKEYLELSPEETIQEYRMNCEGNRLKLLRNFMKKKIEWRNLKYIRFEQYQKNIGSEYHYPFTADAIGYIVLTDGNVLFKLHDIKIFRTVHGYAINADTCSNEIEIIDNV